MGGWIALSPARLCQVCTMHISRILPILALLAHGTNVQAQERKFSQMRAFASFSPQFLFFFFFQEKTIIMTPIGPCPLFPFFLFTKAAGGWKWLGPQWLLLPRVCGCARLDPAPWHRQQSPGCAQGMGSPPALRLGTTSGNKQQQHQDIFPSHHNAYIDEKK